MSAETNLVAELERLHSRAAEARTKAARAEVTAQHRQMELDELAAALKSEYGIESWDAAAEWLKKTEAEAAEAVARARELIEAEGI